MSDEQRDGSASGSLDDIRTLVGVEPDIPQVGRDPVNRPMIHHYCQALGDTNPVHLDEQVARKTRHGGLIAPPGMLGVWTMTMDAVQRDADGPRSRVLRALETEGFDSVVATDYRHVYERQLRPGDHLRELLTVESLSDRKRTALGEGHFVTVRHDYLDQDDQRVGVGRMRLLKYRPRGGGDGGGGLERMRSRPTPAVNRDTRFFWEGVEVGELRIQRCTDCGRLQHPPSAMCGHCRSTDLDHVVSSGRGTVHSHAVHHHPPLPGIRPPHAVVLVDLEEGVRFVTHVTGMRDRDVRVGMPVEIVFEEVPGGQVLPLARPSQPSQLPSHPPRIEALEDATRGQVLPALRVDVTSSFVVAAAIATRDFEEVHHDPVQARERGSEGLFPNILTTNGLCLRLVTDWAGPEARVIEADIRLGVPAYTGEVLELTGEVQRVDPDDGEDGEGTVDVFVRGTVAVGEHVRGTVRIGMPLDETGPVRADQVEAGVWAGEPGAGTVLQGRVAWEREQSSGAPVQDAGPGRHSTSSEEVNP